MDAYLRKLAGIPRLDAATENALAVRAVAGDRAAREQLIVASLSLVLMRAKALGFRDQGLLDAVQAGTIGLIEAVDRFDPSRGCRLATYAWWWIGHAMAKAVVGRDIPVRSDSAAAEIVEPVPVEDIFAGLSPALAEVFRCRFETVLTTGRPRPRKDVAGRLGLTVSQVRSRETKAMQQVRGRLAKVGDRASHEHRGAGPL